MDSHRIEALPKQVEFLQSTDREVCYSGSFGGGKTRALCLKLVMRASVPGAREALVRKTLVSLKATTLHTLIEPDGDLPPVLPMGTYTYNKSDGVIRIHGGGSIVLVGMDKPEKIGSLQLTGAAIDEAVELLEKDYTMLRGRIRVKVTGLCNQIYLATNPGAPSHWIAIRFGLVDDDGAANTHAIHTQSKDNTFLPQDYLDDLDTLTGVARARYVLGQWVAAEGLVYPELAECVVAPADEIPEGVNVGGIDFGWRNPFAALTGTIYKDEDDLDCLYIHSEIYKRETPLEVVTAEIQRIYPVGDCMWFADSAAPEGIRELRMRGLTVRKATKDVLAGIQTVNAMLASGRVYISAACENLLREAATYCYDDRSEKEQPVKENDHLCVVAGTMATTPHGQVPVELLRPGDTVQTHLGWGTVAAASCTGYKETMRLNIGGHPLQCSLNHGIFVKRDGKQCVVMARDLKATDLVFCQTEQWQKSNGGLLQMAPARPLSGGMASDGLPTLDGIYTSAGQPEEKVKVVGCATCGCTRKHSDDTTGKSLMAGPSTTRTGTSGTMQQTTLKHSPSQNTPTSTSGTCTRQCLRHGSGTVVQPDMNGTRKMERDRGKTGCHNQPPVSNAALNTKAIHQNDSVATTANHSTAVNLALMTRIGAAPSVEAAIAAINTLCKRPVAGHAGLKSVDAVESSARHKVYNVATTDGSIVLNGIVTRQCDAMRYLVVGIRKLGMFDRYGIAPDGTE